MLFFILFALCFAAEKTCYRLFKEGETVVGYEELTVTLAEGETKCPDDITDQKPTLTGDVVCLHDGNKCPVDELEKKRCGVAGKCIKATDSTTMKYTLAGNKVKLEFFNSDKCQEDTKNAAATEEYTCGECKENTKAECPASNNPSTPTSYCYEEIKNGDKVVGFKKVIKTGDKCTSPQKDAQPDLKASFICFNKGKEGTQCEWKDSHFESAECYIATEECVEPLDGGSSKYTIKDNKVTATNYDQKGCKGEPQKDNDNTMNCGKCYVEGGRANQIKCEEKSGAFGTFVLLILAFIFFLF